MIPFPNPVADPRRKRRSKRARALLAGGLIAGIGIIGTLATWNSGVLGQINVAGSDTTPPANGLIEFFDAGGNWVSNDNDGAAHLLTDVTLPARTDEGDSRTVRAVNVGKVRLTGVGAADAVDLVGQVGIESDNPDVKTHMKGNLWIAPSCSSFNDVHSFTGDGEGADLLSTLHNSRERTHTVTGPLEMAICFSGHLPYHNVEYFGPDDSAQVSFDLTATPSTESTS